MRHKPGCVFCEIAQGQAPAEIVQDYIEYDVLAFTPLNPVTAGHTLLIPKQHVDRYTEDAEVTARVMGCAAMLGRAWPDSNLITSAGAAATQSVYHLHVHVVPRWPDDGLPLPWTGQDGSTRH